MEVDEDKDKDDEFIESVSFYINDININSVIHQIIIYFRNHRNQVTRQESEELEKNRLNLHNL